MIAAFTCMVYGILGLSGGATEDAMNRWSGTGHLTKEPRFLETDSCAPAITGWSGRGTT